MSGSVDVRRIRETAIEEAAIALYVNDYGEAHPGTAAQRFNARSEQSKAKYRTIARVALDASGLCGELSSALDRAEKAEAERDSWRERAKSGWPSPSSTQEKLLRDRLDGSEQALGAIEWILTESRKRASAKLKLIAVQLRTARAVLAGGDTQ